jgi:NAD(P)-dependent dehydrogenase (short-subunit alcohol dehydrogenase family)
VNQYRTSNRYDFTGQVAIVTGGGRGLGRAFALELASAGAAVAVTARTKSQVDETAQIIRDRGGRALSFVADATDAEAAAMVVKETEQQLGPVDLLVNNAGVMQMKTVAETDADEWWRVIDINLRGPFLWSRAVLTGMMQRSKGRIINVSSGAAYVPHAHGSAYCASKAALTHFTNCFAREVKDHGITVIAYGPDALTDLSRSIYTSDSGMSEERKQRYRQVFESDPDSLMQQSLEMFMFVASGRADALTGRHIHRKDSIEEIEQNADRIVAENLYVLGRNTTVSGGTPAQAR